MGGFERWNHLKCTASQSPSLFTEGVPPLRKVTGDLRTVAVVGEIVDSARGHASDDVLGGGVLDLLAESSRAGRALESAEVGSKTSDVGSSHGSTRDGVLQHS